MNEATFCAFPFNTLFLGADGGVKTCCSSRGTIGDINKNSIHEILHSAKATEVRQSIIDNKWHPDCSQCKELESMGARTERTSVLGQLEKFKDATPNTFILEKLDLRWSNVCNLACNYCYEYFSSQWAAIKGIKVNANKSNSEDSIFALIEEHKDTIIDLNLLGGEPLLQKQNKQLVSLLSDKKYYILSNLSVDVPNNEIAAKLIQNPNAVWGISFDTIGDKFEYVRHGAKWDTFCNNLKFLKDAGVREINAHPLYCAYTAYNLCEFYEFLESEEIFTQAYWCAIQNIPGLNVYTLPKDVKIKALEELDKCIDKYQNSRFDMSALINIRESLSASLGNEEDIHRVEFLKWIDDIENKYLPKEKPFSMLWPELYKELHVRK